MPEMPWELRELPCGAGMRWYRFYLSGGSDVASDQDVQVWRYVQALRARVAELEAAVIVTPNWPTEGIVTAPQPAERPREKRR